MNTSVSNQTHNHTLKVVWSLTDRWGPASNQSFDEMLGMRVFLVMPVIEGHPEMASACAIMEGGSMTSALLEKQMRVMLIKRRQHHIIRAKIANRDVS